MKMVKLSRSQKWIAITVVCLLTLVFVLAGCSTPAPTTSAPATSQAKPTTSTTAPATTTAPAKTTTSAPTSPAAVKVRELRWSHLLSSPNDAGADLSLQMAADVEKLTNGAVKIKIYWAKQIAEPKDVPEMIRQGNIDMGAFPAGDFPTILPLNEQIQTYFTLTNDTRVARDYWWGLYNKVPEVSAEFNKSNMQFLSRQWESVKHTLSKKPLRSAADTKGMKLRFMGGQYASDIVSALGGVRTPTSLAEAYEALMRGSIDCMTIGEDILYTQKYWEIGKYIGLPLGSMPMWMQVINLNTWKSFSPEIQQAFTKANQNFDEAAFKAALNVHTKYKPMLEEKGVQYIDFNQKDWEAAVAAPGDPMAYCKKTLLSRGVSEELATRFTTTWAQIVKESQTKYNTK